MYNINNTIEFVRGDSQIFKIDITDGGGNEYEWQDGDSAIFTVKKSYNDERVLIQKQMKTNMFKLDPSDTRGMDLGEYDYDIQLTQADGTVTTIIPCSQFTLLPEVTI